MEGGDTNCYLLIWGSWALEMSRYSRRPQRVDADLLSRAVLGRRSLLFAFLFFTQIVAGPNKWTEVDDAGATLALLKIWVLQNDGTMISRDDLTCY